MVCSETMSSNCILSSRSVNSQGTSKNHYPPIDNSLPTIPPENVAFVSPSETKSDFQFRPQESSMRSGTRVCWLSSQVKGKAQNSRKGACWACWLGKTRVRLSTTLYI